MGGEDPVQQPRVAILVSSDNPPPPADKLENLKPDEIKSCLFCGGDEVTLRCIWHLNRLMPCWKYVIVCSSCAAQGGWAKSAGNALHNWNMRLRAEEPFATLRETIEETVE